MENWGLPVGNRQPRYFPRFPPFFPQAPQALIFIIVVMPVSFDCDGLVEAKPADNGKL